MANNPNTLIVDKAIAFATKAHSGVYRKGNHLPYILHPMEAASIVATMTEDQELIAAAVLHDVLEDTDVTYKEILSEFGERVAKLVLSESEEPIPSLSMEQSWKARKEAAIDRLAKSSHDSKIVALGDKLSNMRAIRSDFRRFGDELWQRFHVQDPALHEWHYRALAQALSELSEYDAYQEFIRLIDETFPKRKVPFTFQMAEEEVHLHGFLDGEAFASLKKALSKDTSYLFDFADVQEINFAGLRALLELKELGHDFVIREASESVARTLDVTGVSAVISVVRAPVAHDMDDLEQFGDGYTAVSYYTSDGDGMAKLYYEFMNPREVEREKRYATIALRMGVPSPICGDLIKIDGKTGIIFERIHQKVSFAREYANHLEKREELAKSFAELSKKLHQTPCNTVVFPNAKTLYRGFAMKLAEVSEEERQGIIAFIDDLPDVTTCLHGDFHTGNAILANGWEPLWIDMGDFCYGDPLIDIGTLYFITHGTHTGDKTPERLFHTNNENLYAFWQSFIQYYFPGQSEEELDQLLRPYCGLTILHFAAKTKQKPWMASAIKEMILGRKR